MYTYWFTFILIHSTDKIGKVLKEAGKVDGIALGRSIALTAVKRFNFCDVDQLSIEFDDPIVT